MRKRILAMLRFMNIREVEQPNKGRIHIDKEALTAEVEKNGGKIVFDEEGYRRWKQEETTANQTPSIPQTIRNRNGAPRRDEDLGVGDQIQSSSHENHRKENISSFAKESNVLHESEAVVTSRDILFSRSNCTTSTPDEEAKLNVQTSIISFTPKCTPSHHANGAEPDRVLSDSVLQRNDNNKHGYDSHHESKFNSNGEIKPQFQRSRRPPPQDFFPRPRDGGQNFKRDDRRAHTGILNGRGNQRRRSPPHSVIGDDYDKSFDHSDEPGIVYDGSHRSHIRTRSPSPSLEHAIDSRNSRYYAKNNRYTEQCSEDGTISSNEANQNHSNPYDTDASYQGGARHRNERIVGDHSRGYSSNDRNIVKRESIGYGQFVRDGRRGYDI